MDLVVETGRPALPGETYVGKRFYTAPGGKGANQAVAAARFAMRSDGQSLQVAMIGAVGDDLFGQQLSDFMRVEGIDASRVSVKTDVSSGIAVIFIDDAGENYVNPVYGANDMCGSDEVAAFARLADAGSVQVLLVQQEVPMETTHQAIRLAQRHGITVVLDPAPARTDDDIPDGFYADVDVVTPNETEAEALSGMTITGIADAENAARKIRDELGPKNVVITLGNKGAIALTADVDMLRIQPHNVPVLASVAAGDAFAGVLGQALAEGCNFRDALELGAAAGALCVTKPGAQEAMPTRAEVLSLAAGRIQTWLHWRPRS